MNRPERTVVCNPANIKPLSLIDEVERLMQFAKLAECVNRPPEVPSNPTNGRPENTADAVSSNRNSNTRAA
jgi:hypothetical protein